MMATFVSTSRLFLSLRPLSVRRIHLGSASRQRFFTKRHEWVDLNGRGAATVGITKYAEESLGDVVFVQLPEPGTSLAAGDECGALESVKAASEIYSPLSGTVSAKNESVEDKPALLNKSPMDEGWLFKLKLSDETAEKESLLLSEEQYNVFLESTDENNN